MIAKWIKVRVKPELRQRFLDAIEVDAVGSERDEPGCVRFNVLQDDSDENVYYFYEVYRDQAAVEARRAALCRLEGLRGHVGRTDRTYRVHLRFSGRRGLLDV